MVINDINSSSDEQVNKSLLKRLLIKMQWSLTHHLKIKFRKRESSIKWFQQPVLPNCPWYGPDQIWTQTPVLQFNDFF